MKVFWVRLSIVIHVSDSGGGGGGFGCFETR